MNHRAQAAVEYMVITGLSLLILLVLLNAAQQQVSKTQAQTRMDAVGKAADKIKEAADFVYVHGHPTRLTIDVYLPPELDPERSYIANSTINLALKVGGTYSDVWRGTRGKVAWDARGNSKIPAIEGYYTLVVESTDESLGGVIDVHLK